ncbi:PilZ domain-containing protein [Undibacterium cyanobacteriorum]|uniref:PilZ domain-containing protein n=1 Tax=Undibacterium cyanobacteriorum TaxID=3073561 RepID=A0ABY9RF61_9BURK|nr:PilZ domain-containing protein [Undibacterium sp. 20NA77.5]WMW79290.1 PilZ domain-containing protein [Undibacterium sp. 20NA77.5]
MALELRRSPRINVTWRGAFRAADGSILPIKVINISDSGILFQCPQPAAITRDYQMMLEIPHIDHIREMYKVPCKVHVLHCILSGDFFRVGVKFVEISELHRDLLAAWVSLTSKLDP